MRGEEGRKESEKEGGGGGGKEGVLKIYTSDKFAYW